MGDDRPVAEREWLFKRKGATQWTYSWVPDDAAPTKRAQKLLPEEVRSERDAKRYVNQHRAELRASEAKRQTGRGKTVADLTEDWLKLRDNDERLAGSTVRDNRSHMKTHVLPALGTEIVSKLEAPRLRAFVRALRKSGAAPYTVRNVVATLTLFLDDIVSEGWVKMAVNPARQKAVRQEMPEAAPRAGRSQKLRIADLEVGQRLVSADAVPVERRVRNLVALTTGERDGEIAGLLWSDIDLDARVPVVHVRKALQLKVRGGHAKMGKTKTKHSVRTLPLHPATVEALRWWLAVGWEDHVGAAPRPQDPLFPYSTGNAWRPQSAKFLRRDLEAVGAASAVDGFPLTFHATRRSFASWLNAAAVPEDARAHLLGHEPKEVGAKHYTEQDMDLLAEFVARIGLVWRMP